MIGVHKGDTSVDGQPLSVALGAVQSGIQTFCYISMQQKLATMTLYSNNTIILF